MVVVGVWGVVGWFWGRGRKVGLVVLGYRWEGGMSCLGWGVEVLVVYFWVVEEGVGCFVGGIEVDL